MRILSVSIGFLLLSTLFGCVSAPGNSPSSIVYNIQSGGVELLAAPPPDLLDNPAYKTSEIVLRRIPLRHVHHGVATRRESARPGLDESPHQVTITREFHMGVFEVTQEQWELVMGANPSFFKGAGSGLPVESVNWHECQEFIDKLNARSATLVFAFPTEAEWEYACRAGSEDPYAGSGRIDEMGWHSQNSDGHPHPVGLKTPNAWGLYDTHGNVLEWCSDWYGKYPDGDAIDPTGPPEGEYRIERGGSWSTDPQFCRSADRNMHIPADSSHHLGLRLLARSRDARQPPL